MSHNPPKNMYKDENGMHRFLNEASAPAAGGGKRWFQVEIVRKALDKEGSSLETDRQQTDVFATEDTAAGLAFSRCPNRLLIKDAFQFTCTAYVQAMRQDDLFSGHVTERQQFLEAAAAQPEVVVQVN